MCMRTVCPHTHTHTNTVYKALMSRGMCSNLVKCWVELSLDAWREGQRLEEAEQAVLGLALLILVCLSTPMPW